MRVGVGSVHSFHRLSAVLHCRRWSHSILQHTNRDFEEGATIARRAASGSIRTARTAGTTQATIASRSGHNGTPARGCATAWLSPQRALRSRGSAAPTMYESTANRPTPRAHGSRRCPWRHDIERRCCQVCCGTTSLGAHTWLHRSPHHVVKALMAKFVLGMRVAGPNLAQSLTELGLSAHDRIAEDVIRLVLRPA
jgi:hypothetical protein